MFPPKRSQPGQECEDGLSIEAEMVGEMRERLKKYEVAA